MKSKPKIDDAVDVGVLMGQQHTFGLVAGRCSAASAQYLRQIRNEKKYRALGMTWKEFCTRRLGISRTSADRVIQQFEELGPGYFMLSQVTHITADEYRRIAGSVSETALIHRNETIAISAENAPRLAAAIEDLQRPTEPEAAPSTTDDGLDRSFRKAERALQAALEEFEAIQSRPLDVAGRVRLQTALGSRLDRLNLLQMSLRV